MQSDASDGHTVTSICVALLYGIRARLMSASLTSTGRSSKSAMNSSDSGQYQNPSAVRAI